MTRRYQSLVALTTILLLVGIGLYLTRDPRPHYAARRSRLAEVEAGAQVIEGGYVLQPVRLRASSGLSVDITVKRAIADSGRTLPVVLVLGGHRTGRDAVRLVGPTAGTMVAGMSYPYAGDPRPEKLTFLRDIPKIRQAFLDTPPAAMLALDYLLARPDADISRVEAVGVSLGAPFVVAAGALDHRVTRVWAMHGSGGSYAPLEMAMRRTIGIAPLRWVAAAISNVIIDGPWLAPERWVASISPRAYVQINTRDDERLPRKYMERLFATAREPKEMIWVEGAHIRSDTAVVRPLVRLVLNRLGVDTAALRRP
jgi:dienelactone hydrolase